MVTNQLFEASLNGDLSYLESLNPDQINDKIVDEYGANICHYAARAGRREILEFLVNKKGLDPRKRSNVGSTPAHDAAAAGKLQTLEWLLSKTNPPLPEDDQDGTGATILHLAARYGHMSVLEWILNNTRCNLTITAASGAIPLHFAASGGNLDAVKLLIQEEPRSVNSQMVNGATPCYIAAQSGHLEILQFLVQKGGIVKINAYDGMSCLHAAAQNGHLTCVQFLVSNQKCNVNERDFDGASPLHFAASRCHPEVIQWLMTTGGAKVTLDNLGGSPLHNAAEVGNIKVVRVLLENHCSPDITDNSGLTAAELAEKCSNDLCAQEIKSKPLSENSDSEPTWQNKTQHVIFVKSSEKKVEKGSYVCVLSKETGECESSQETVLENHQSDSLKGEQLDVNRGDSNSDLSSVTSSLSSYSFSEEVEIKIPQKSQNSHQFIQRYNFPAKPSFNFPQSQSTQIERQITSAQKTKMSDTEVDTQETHVAKVVMRNSNNGSSMNKSSLLSELSDKVKMVQADDDLDSATYTHEATGVSKPVRPVSLLSEPKRSYSPSSSRSSGSTRSSPTGPNPDFVTELKKAASAPTLKKTKKPKEEGQMNCIYSFGGPIAKSVNGMNGTSSSMPNGTSADHKNDDTKPLNLEGEFDPKNFLDQVDGIDKAGNPVPLWKRQMYARQLAEKAFKAAEEQRKLDEIEARFKNMPPWKRQLIERKEAEARAAKEKDVQNTKSATSDKQNSTSWIQKKPQGLKS